MGRIVRVAVVLLVVLPDVLLSNLPSAQALDCTEYGIALQKPSQNAYGSQGNIFAVNQTLDACSPPGRTAQTLLMILSSDNKNWVEVGYTVYEHCVLGVCSTEHKSWGEWGYAGISNGDGTNYNYSDITVGSSPRYKINNVPGSWDWKLWVDTSGGTNFQLLDDYTGMWAQYGWALGEVSKHGGSGDVSAANHEWNLEFKNQFGNWNDWSGLRCPGSQGWDSLNGWQWDHFNSNTEFRVVQGSTYC